MRWVKTGFAVFESDEESSQIRPFNAIGYDSIQFQPLAR